mgnify:CR=1 FL=1
MLLAVLSLFFANPALAARVSLTGGAVSTLYSYSGPISTKGGTGFGGGLLLEIVRTRAISIEGGGLFLSRRFEDEAAGVTTARSVSSILVPVTLFIHAGNQASFYLGAGPFFNKVLKFDSYGGAQAQLRLAYRLSSRAELFVGAQYLHGLEKDEVGIAHRDLLMLLGLSFGGSKK